MSRIFLSLLFVIGVVNLVAAQSTQPARKDVANDAKASAAAAGQFRRVQRPGHGRAQMSAASAKSADTLIARGLDALKSRREPGGGWMEAHGPAVTAIVGKAFAQDPSYGPRHEIVHRAAEFVLGHQRPDGAFAGPRSALANYETAVAVMFLSDLRDTHPGATPAIERAISFFRTIQWDEDDNISTTAAEYGGFRYGKAAPGEKRPDLSNTQMTLEALQQAGLPTDDPMVQKALAYVQRCQDHSKTNDLPWARLPAPQDHQPGGFIYMSTTEVPEEELSKAGTVVGGERPRAYGSMTYAGLKSMIYAGLSQDDPRVRAAVSWIRDFYTLEQNPNMPNPRHLQGLYYYYQTFAQALQAMDLTTLPTARGPRNWREDLVAALGSRQQQDGTWVNQADRWMEGQPAYVTAIAILALQSALN